MNPKEYLIVIDMQKDFIDGALGFEGADKIIPGIIACKRRRQGNHRCRNRRNP